MNRALLTWAGLAVAIIVVAQTAHTAGGPAKTSWGEPDLQGFGPTNTRSLGSDLPGMPGKRCSPTRSGQSWTAVEEASRRLVKERFPLQEDADRYIQGAKDSDILRPKD